MIKENLQKEVKYVFDRGMDRDILKDFIIVQCGKFILRLKKNSKLIHNGEELRADQIAEGVSLTKEMTAVKIKKNKKRSRYLNMEPLKYNTKLGGTYLIFG